MIGTVNTQGSSTDEEKEPKSVNLRIFRVSIKAKPIPSVPAAADAFGLMGGGSDVTPLWGL